MQKTALAFMLIGIFCCSTFAQDIDLNGVVGPEDLFLLSNSWDVFLNDERSLDFLNQWQDEIIYKPDDPSVVLEIPSEGNEPQVYVDHQGIAYMIYEKRTPELAPDGTTVMTCQLAYTSILPGGEYWMKEQILTERKPNIYVFGGYYGPTLNELILVGPEDKQGDFFAIWQHYSSGFSMIRFNSYGVPVTKEYVADDRLLDDVDRFNAVMDPDGNIHIVWKEDCSSCKADSKINSITQVIRYSKFTPEGDMLIDPPVTLGTRASSSGSAEIFRPIIRRLPSTNDFLVMIDQNLSNPTLAVKIDGDDGSILSSTTLSHNFVEPDFLEMANGDIAMAAMISLSGTGRNIYFSVLNSDLSEKVAPVGLTNTMQQSDGAAIAAVDDDFYVAWYDYSDYYMKLARMNANGSRQGSLVRLNGPAENVIPYRLRMVSDFSGLAHIVYANGEGTPVKISYEKLKIN